MLPDMETAIAEYLRENDYATAEEWASDSDYVYDKDTDQWTDEHGDVIDPYVQLQGAIESVGSESEAGGCSICGFPATHFPVVWDASTYCCSCYDCDDLEHKQ